MGKYNLKIYLSFLLTSIGTFVNSSPELIHQNIISHVVHSGDSTLRMYWKNESDKVIGSIQSLKTMIEQTGDSLIFAMNGGMYLPDQSPQGLFIQNEITHRPLDTVKQGYGNFYMKPNGVFYIHTNHQAGVCSTEKFKSLRDVKYATQSGPMLLIDGEIHPRFNQGSSNVHIRNGVGVLPNGDILFAMSKQKINFYDFASWFQSKGCQNALYLDGFVSRTYLPLANWKQLDGNFGVIIGQTSK
ncbi:MAG: phosphodiester glycosidase family protein [Bacteroidales bacterium]|nr:phosphodiester glycosidase family protein [Bacteroidales bacterium]